MKNLCIVILIGLGLTVNGQQNLESEIRNDVKLNIMYTIAGMPTFDFERIRETDQGIGLSITLDLEHGSGAAFIPYYRMYFGKGIARGFFIEANSALTMTKSSESGSGLRLGVGMAIGAKFLTKSGMIGEIFAGGGRLFENSEGPTYGYPRLGVMFGKRFSRKATMKPKY